MSKNAPQAVHDGAVQAALKKRPKPDPRAARTRTRLGMAFIQLIHEKPIEAVTVQDVLDRASIGRSTFYLHFRDKNDLLLSQLEMFCEFQSGVLVESREKSHRVMPVAENRRRIVTYRRRSAGRAPPAAPAGHIARDPAGRKTGARQPRAALRRAENPACSSPH